MAGDVQSRSVACGLQGRHRRRHGSRLSSVRRSTGLRRPGRRVLWSGLRRIARGAARSMGRHPMPRTGIRTGMGRTGMGRTGMGRTRMMTGRSVLLGRLTLERYADQASDDLPYVRLRAVRAVPKHHDQLVGLHRRSFDLQRAGHREMAPVVPLELELLAALDGLERVGVLCSVGRRREVGDVQPKGVQVALLVVLRIEMHPDPVVGSGSSGMRSKVTRLPGQLVVRVRRGRGR